MEGVPPTADDKVLGELARFTVGPLATDNDILCLMILLHTHRLTFARPILPTRPDALQSGPLTQRGAAAVTASAFPQHNPAELYWMFNSAGRGSFAVMDDVPSELAAHVMALKAKLLTHPDVTAIDPED
jgi:hypothetical protein